MIGEESASILKQDKEEWELLFNLTQQGSNNWCLNVVKRLLMFGINEQTENNKTDDDKNSSSPSLLLLENGLKKINEIIKHKILSD